MKENSAKLVSYYNVFIATSLASAVRATAIANDDVPAAAPAHYRGGVHARYIRLVHYLLLLRHRPRAAFWPLQHPRFAAIRFHHALQHTAYAAGETYVIQILQNRCEHRTVTDIAALLSKNVIDWSLSSRCSTLARSAATVSSAMRVSTVARAELRKRCATLSSRLDREQPGIAHNPSATIAPRKGSLPGRRACDEGRSLLLGGLGAYELCRTAIPRPGAVRADVLDYSLTSTTPNPPRRFRHDLFRRRPIFTARGEHFSARP